jgi:hypothetical protein
MSDEEITQQVTEDGAVDAPERADTDDPQAALRREAAGYRTRLREVEAERDTLQATVAAMQRAEVERVAGTASEGFRPLAAPEDLWLGGVELDGLLAEDGTVDAGRVREAVGALAAQRPHWLASTSRPGGADSGRGAGAQRDEAPSFGAALKGA